MTRVTWFNVTYPAVAAVELSSARDPLDGHIQFARLDCFDIAKRL